MKIPITMMRDTSFDGPGVDSSKQQTQSINTTHRVLVPASKVVMVEFDKEPIEYTHDQAKHEQIVSELVKLNEEAAKETQDAKSADKDESAATTERETSERPAAEAPTDGQPA